MLSVVVSANDGDFIDGTGHLETVDAANGLLVGLFDQEGNEIKSKKAQHFYHFPVSAKVLIKPPYRIWQMAFFCSTKFSSNLTVKPQLLPELTAAGACQ